MRFLFLAGILVVLMTLNCHPNQPSRPNVLFIAIDDLNDWIEPLGGHPQTRTPHLAAFAQEALTFTQAHTPAPLCNPARVSIMTGLHPRTTGITANNAYYPFREHLPAVETMVQHFQKAGYYTAGFGKIFHKKDSQTEPWDQYEWASGRPKSNPFPGHGIPALVDSVYRYFDWGPVEAPLERWGEHRTAEGAINVLQQNHHQPFFLAVGMRLPHLAWNVPTAFYASFDSLEIVLPQVDTGDLADLPDFALAATRKNRLAQQLIVQAGVWQEAVKSYLAAIHYIDYEIGRILAGLATSQYNEETIVVIWSDHGFHLGEKSTWRKNTLWEESTRIPLLVRTPDMTMAGQQSHQLVSLLDLYPTLIQLCNLAPREDLEGQDFSPLLLGADQAIRDYVITTTEIGSTVRTLDWRYIRYTDGSEELYHRFEDTLEHHNLIGTKGYEKVVNRMKAYLEE